MSEKLGQTYFLTTQLIRPMSTLPFIHGGLHFLCCMLPTVFIPVLVRHKRLVYGHELYLRCGISVPVVIRPYEEVTLEEPWELLAQAECRPPTCTAWVARTSF